MKIVVLRLGHRIGRDKRITTHLALTARAFGADKLIYSGEKDSSLEESVRDVVNRWGGEFKITHTERWRKIIKNWKGTIIHLTVYGIPIQKRIGKIQKQKKDKLIIVGGKKVPGEVYEMSDYNISVTQQPHSELSALVIFLHELFEGEELEKEFKNAEIRVIPQEKGKKVVET